MSGPRCWYGLPPDVCNRPFSEHWDAQLGTLLGHAFMSRPKPARAASPEPTPGLREASPPAPDRAALREALHTESDNRLTMYGGDPVLLREQLHKGIDATIDAARAAAPSVEPIRTTAGGDPEYPHIPEPSDICSVCGRGLVHVIPSLDPPASDRAAGLREAAERVLDWADYHEPWNPDGAFAALYEATGRRPPEGDEPKGPRYYRAALLASDEPTGLEVERLRDAIKNVTPWKHGGLPWARAIAAEYARLAERTEDKPND